MALTVATRRLTPIALTACVWMSLSSAWAQAPHIEPIPRPQALPVTSTLTRSLAAWDKEQAQLAKECAKDVAQIKAREKNSPISVEFNLRYEVLLDSSRIYTVASLLNIYCGGPYPAFVENAVVFDLTTGKRYDPLKLYAISLRGRYGAEFRPAIRKMVREALIAERKPIEKDDDCIPVLQQDEIQMIEKDTIGLGAQGLHVMYAGAHVVQACYGNVVLPYERLQKFLNTKEAKRIHWVH